MSTPVVPLPQFDVVEICQEASERAGIEFRSGYSLITARRSLELLMLEWASRGLQLWTLQWDTLPLTPGLNPHPLPADTIDVLDVALRRMTPYTEPHIYPPGFPQGVTDTPLTRLGSGDWAVTGSKHAPGLPSSYYVNRLVQPVIYLDPPLNQSSFDGGATVLYYSRLRYMQPLPSGGAGVPEMPLRFVNAMISGLAFHLAMKSREPQARANAPFLKQLYETDFELAADEDRERVSFFARPDTGLYGY